MKGETFSPPAFIADWQGSPKWLRYGFIIAAGVIVVGLLFGRGC